jgi:hypothetical protein
MNMWTIGNPPKDEYVLVTVTPQELPPFVMRAKHDGIGWQPAYLEVNSEGGKNWNIEDKVTAWMPLPKPYTINCL